MLMILELQANRFWSYKRAHEELQARHRPHDVVVSDFIYQTMDGVEFPIEKKYVFNISLGKKMQKGPSSLFSLARLRVRIRSLAASILPFASTATFEDFEQSLMALMGGFLQ